MSIEFEQTKTIEGYTVEVWPADDDGVEHAYVSKGKYSASWESLEGNGTLDNGIEDVPVSQDDMEAIEDWLESVGYFS